MQNRNICKFIPSTYADTLSTACFVLESNIEVMQTDNTLTRYRMILLLEGKGTFILDNLKIPFSKGDLIIAFKGEKIVAEVENDTKYMYIDFDGIRAEELIKRFNISKNNRVFKGFDGLISIWKESLLRASDNTIDLASESMVLYAFSRFNTEISRRDTIISKILQITEERFNDSRLSLSVIADELGYNSKCLSHLFKEKMNTRYSEYLRVMRIKYAVSLFDHGIDSVKNVALLSGFSDPLYFSTVFKKSTGLSPKEYVNKI